MSRVAINVTTYIDGVIKSSYINGMIITYDESKRLSNIVKHGFDFAELDFDFFLSAIVIPAKSDRYMAIGDFQGAVIVAVVFAPLGSEALSVISMRRADRQERAIYEDTSP